MRQTLILLSFLSTSVGAQVRLKLNYNKHWEITTPDSAAYIRVGIYDTINYVFAGPVTDLYLNGKPQMKGVYKFKKKEGQFTFYYENGNVESMGMFENDIRVGVWKYFYRNGQPKMEADFKPIIGEDQIILFLNDSTGKQLMNNGNGQWIETIDVYHEPSLIITGNFLYNMRDGKWTVQQLNGERVLEEIYDHGKFVRGTTFRDLFGGRSRVSSKDAKIPTLPLPYKFSITEEFDAVSGVDFTTYPKLKFLKIISKSGLRIPLTNHRDTTLEVDTVTTGDKTVYEVIEQPPSAREPVTEFAHFIGQNMKYPPDARRAGIQGIVYIEFIIETNGLLTNFKVNKGIGSGCDEEALRVMKLYGNTHQWKPGTQKGEPVRTRFVMPLTFKLG